MATAAEVTIWVGDIPIDELQKWEPITQQSVLKLSEEDQAMLRSTYNTKKRNVGAMVALAVLFPIQLFLLNKVGLAVVRHAQIAT